MRNTCVLTCLVLTLVVVLGNPVFGQSNYGKIAGIVADEQNLPISGVGIQLTAGNTGAVRRVATNDQGLFEAPALLPDTYQLKAEASGFAAETETIRLEVGQNLTLKVALRVGAVKQGVNVTACQ